MTGAPRLGVIIPNSGPLPRRLGLAAMGRTAEAAGAESLWVSDHLLMVDRPVDDYPYSPDGAITWDAGEDYYEALTCCTLLAAATERCRIGTAVLVLPQRNPLQVAKEAATIDRVSGGRLELGVGAGWSEAEMTALGYSFRDRGIRLEESMAILRDCWTGRTSAFAGRTSEVPEGLLMRPRPVRDQGIPLLVGGHSAAAVRRAATLADGWLGIGFAEAWDEEGLTRALAAFRSRWAGAGRPGRGRALLKLHCARDFAHLPGRVSWAAEAGFDEVIVELPWAEGLPAASAVCARLASASGR
ncbi:TIGR03619 family F420-dependent LLM class oxidoreductase [Actinomadura sp. B10D3]|uniref:TIGR03619 family F420-dependent LLM class oxidoreductase n=1 Tax=Actinomadura sp. B10D3 TaxID=3153557 RepID=UPI00325C94F3